jgi:DNA-binding LytR/AlgR family response regulator
MKRKKSLAAKVTLPVVIHAITCSKCGSEVNAKQQDYDISVDVDHSSLSFHASDVVCITVEKNYCVFKVLKPRSSLVIEEFRVRSALSDWENLMEYGLVRVSRDCILNLAHVYKAKGHRLYSHFLPHGVEVTKSFEQQVAKMLKPWSGIDHVFPG